jgi:hypothetical protein
MKITFSDLNCDTCEKKTSLGCSHSKCPFIMGNLTRFLSDGVFREAVQDADNCKTHQKNTLKYLKKMAAKHREDFWEGFSNGGSEQRAD